MPDEHSPFVKQAIPAGFKVPPPIGPVPPAGAEQALGCVQVNVPVQQKALTHSLGPVQVSPLAFKPPVAPDSTPVVGGASQRPVVGLHRKLAHSEGLEQAIPTAYPLALVGMVQTLPEQLLDSHSELALQDI